MFRILICSALLALPLPCLTGGPLADVLPLIPKEEKTTQLFDGLSLEGWDGDAKYWSVKNGEIVGARVAGVCGCTCSDGYGGDLRG